MEFWQILRLTCLVLFGSLTIVSHTCAEGIFSANEDNVYYIAAVEVDWDYAPDGNTVSEYLKSDAEKYNARTRSQIGKTYKKAVYREYTNSSFTVQKAHRGDLGILGPTIKAYTYTEVTIHFKNLASRPYSIYVNGAIYRDKASEGAKYSDATPDEMKADDGVAPGGQYTYHWKVMYPHTPDIGDDRCVPWIYHSHVDSVKDMNSGLVGVFLACHKDSPIVGPFMEGMFREKQGHKVDKEFALLFTTFDENKSWYLDENMRSYNVQDEFKTDSEFVRSNKKSSINGRSYGNLQGLSTCEGDNISWFLVGLGSSADIHGITFHGQTVINTNYRKGSVGIFPSEQTSARMLAREPGRWLVRDDAHDHYLAGMQAFLDVRSCGKKVEEELPGNATKTYYIAAEEHFWNYAPSGKDLLADKNLDDKGSASRKYFKKDHHHIGGRYKKALFIEYQDGSFLSKKRRGKSDKYLGFLGPMIKANVGDTIKVVFKNFASRPYSIHPRGVHYNKSYEGAWYNDGTKGKQRHDDRVKPGSTFTYYWTVPQSVDETPYGPDCRTWAYTSGVDMVKDVHSGLVGPLTICSNRKQKRYKEVDNYFYLYPSVTDETLSHYLDENLLRVADPLGAKKNNVKDFLESNRMYSINGYSYGNMPVLSMCKNSLSVFNLFSLGIGRDVHNINFNGEALEEYYMTRSYVPLTPGVAKSLAMVAVNEGEWILECHNLEHLEGGEKAKFRIGNCQQEPSRFKEHFRKSTGRVRTYYIGAVEEEWDYASNDYDVMTGHKLSDPERTSYKYYANTEKYLGHRYKKALYREYTSNNFSEEKERPAEQLHLGILGPIIFAGEGDTIKIHFRNMASRPYSIHGLGVAYNKSSEGMSYHDNHGNNDGDAVQPGDTYIYQWKIPDRFTGEFPDPMCITRAYYSSVDPVRDTHSGLLGPILICNSVVLDKKSGNRASVDFYEPYLLFMVFDENRSWYIDDNIAAFAQDPAKIDTKDEDFIESNRMYSINGYIYGNLPTIVMDKYKWIEWHLMSWGKEIHSASIHGNTLRVDINAHETRQSSVSLVPGMFTSVHTQMQYMWPGVWLIRCYNNDHFQKGMFGLFAYYDVSVGAMYPIRKLGGLSVVTILWITLCCICFACLVGLLGFLRWCYVQHNTTVMTVTKTTNATTTSTKTEVILAEEEKLTPDDEKPAEPVAV